MLPWMNGFEVLREFDSCAPFLVPRTIVVTAASQATLRDFDSSRVFALLRKPFDLGQLRRAVRLCSGARSYDVAQRAGHPGSLLDDI